MYQKSIAHLPFQQSFVVNYETSHKLEDVTYIFYRFTMKKTLVASGVLAAFFLVGCSANQLSNAPEDRLAKMLAKGVCMMQETKTMMEEAMKGSGSTVTPEEAMKKGQEIKDRMEKVVTESGFKDEKEAESVYRGLTDKTAFTAKVVTQAMGECKADASVVEEFMKNL